MKKLIFILILVGGIFVSPSINADPRIDISIAKIEIGISKAYADPKDRLETLVYYDPPKILRNPGRV